MSSHASLMISVSGIRGVVGTALGPGQALDFVQAYAAFLKAHARENGHGRPRVLIARDTRPTGDMMHHAALAGLIAAGCEVRDLGVVSTPTLQLAIPALQAAGAICITASHNPVEWNALKFFQPSGMYLDKEQGGEVLRLYAARDFECGSWQEMGTVAEETGAVERHIAHVLEYVDADLIRSKKFKVVLDGCNGAGSLISPQLLRELGCEVVTINVEPNGLFPHNPEPLNENLVQLCDAVKAHGADIGFAHDADADRVGVVTNEGEPIGEDYSLVWAEACVLKYHERGPVVTNLSTTMAVDAVAAQHDCETHRAPVGDINVSSLMREVGAVIGGEGNGGVIMPRVQFGRDGIAALALILEFVAREGATAAEVGRTLPRFFIRKGTVDFPRDKTAMMLTWMKSREKTARFDERDGLKIIWPREGEMQSWAHIRPSGTEPFVRVICEAKTEAESRRIEKVLRGEMAALAISL